MAGVGPFVNQTITTKTEDTQFKYVSSPKSYDYPLPYLRVLHRAQGLKGRQLMSNLGNEPISKAQALYPLLYDKAFNRMYERANLAISAWESGKSLAMITKRSRQLFLAARALRRLRFFEFANILGIRGYHPPTRSRVKRITESGGDVSDLWLEAVFGWRPLIQDIYQATQVLQQDFGFSRFIVRTRRAGNMVKLPDPTYPYYDNSYSVGYTSFAYLGGKVRVTNPNLFLANQLGLTNPAAVFYDAIPFSFVLDWFIPVQKFLTSFQNELGLELSGLYFGYGYKANGQYTFRDFQGKPEEFGGCSTKIWLNRTTPSTLPIPSVLSRLRVPDASPWLAMTSLSLLTQQLNGLLGSDGRLKPR